MEGWYQNTMRVFKEENFLILLLAKANGSPGEASQIL
jgi:hypothetical protein